MRAMQHPLDAEIEAIESETVAKVAGAALGWERVTGVSWRGVPLPYRQFLPDRRLLRLGGEAFAGPVAAPWSAVLKLIASETGAATEAGEASARREVLAYRSGLLADMPGPLRAPRLLRLDEAAGGATRLWLEDVVDRFKGPWPLAHYAVAARHLGHCNGIYAVVRPMPAAPWLDARWTEGHGDPSAAEICLDEIAVLSAHPSVARLLPRGAVERVARLLRDQRRFAGVLNDLPQTLCHHEAARANLIARCGADGGDETVALDWETIGPGPLGAEVASLVFGTLRRFEVDAGEAGHLDRLVLDGYLAGLADAGWHGESARVRLGYCAAVSLRWGMIIGMVRAIADLESRAALLRAHRVTLPALLRQYLPLSAFLLDRADEARRLIDGGHA